MDRIRFESDNFFISKKIYCLVRMRNRELNRDQNLIGGQMAVQKLNGDQRLNRFGAMQFTPELGSNSDLTLVQS